jgi:hypothetical protein
MPRRSRAGLKARNTPWLRERETSGKAIAAERDHQPAPIDKSVLAVSTCLLCGRKPSDPRHLRFMQPRALGRKVSDEFSVPLCRIHHRLAHRAGDEAVWWKEAGIDPIEAARKLWTETRRAEGGEEARPQELSRSTGEPDRRLLAGRGDGTTP